MLLGPGKAAKAEKRRRRPKASKGLIDSSPMTVADPPSTEALEDSLQRLFGHRAFRPGQRRTIEAVVAGQDVVAVMPTGAGKSLCYQLPALLLQGTTVVVSPLIALMKDQVDALRAKGFAAAAIHSGLLPGERRQAEEYLRDGRLQLVYLAPERLASDRFRDALARTRVSRLVIDEAHCISQWGHDFRPDYRRLGDFRRHLGVPAAAFTATATPDVRGDIIRQLGLESPLELVTGFERPNLTLAVEECSSRVSKARALDRVIREMGCPGIVYASTRKGVELWAALLQERGLKAGSYHAGLSDEERHRVQDAFLAGELEAIAATNAFGMGIDKSDIRFVVHADLPGSVEAYYQEAGRAGRDGLPSRCVLLFSPADVRTQEFFIAGSNPSAAAFRQVWHMLGQGFGREQIEIATEGDTSTRMAASTAARLLRQAAESQRRPLGEGDPPVDLQQREEKARRDTERLQATVHYANSRTCRTGFIFRYFLGSDEAESATCGTCDVCLGWRFGDGRELDEDELLRVRIALSGIARLSGRFGLGRIAQVLTGSRSREIESRGLHRLPTYGKLAALGGEAVKSLLNVLLEGGLAQRQPVRGGRPGAFVIALTSEGRAVMMGESKPLLPLPSRNASPPSTATPEAGRPLAAPALRTPTSPLSSSQEILDGADPQLFEQLKSWRTEQAHRQKVPAYLVFSNKTLTALATLRPRNLDELLEVKGIGPAKVERYGEAVMEILGSKTL